MKSEAGKGGKFVLRSAVAFKDGRVNFNIIPTEQVLAEAKLIWVDLENPTAEETAVLSEVFEFHPLTIEDCLHYLQRPKLDEYEAYVFMVLHAFRKSESAVTPTELDIYLGNNFVVTFHWHKLPAIEKIYERLTKNTSLLTIGTDYLFYLLLNAQVEEYFPLLDELEIQIDKIEDRTLRNPEADILYQIKRTRSVVSKIRKAFSPQREIFTHLLRHDFPYISKDTRNYLMDVYDHLLRLFDMVESHREALAGVLEIYLSGTSNRLNEVMKVLTIISTIMMPLTVLAGIYGMNFQFMPELRWRFGYPMALGMMALITLIMLVYFKRKRWL